MDNNTFSGTEISCLMDTNWDNGWLNSINLTNAVHVVTKPSHKEVEAI